MEWNAVFRWSASLCGGPCSRYRVDGLVIAVLEKAGLGVVGDKLVLRVCATIVILTPPQGSGSGSTPEARACLSARPSILLPLSRLPASSSERPLAQKDCCEMKH